VNEDTKKIFKKIKEKLKEKIISLETSIKDEKSKV
jgi:hypothetical protein